MHALFTLLNEFCNITISTPETNQLRGVVTNCSSTIRPLPWIGEFLEDKCTSYAGLKLLSCDGALLSLKREVNRSILLSNSSHEKACHLIDSVRVDQETVEIGELGCKSGVIKLSFYMSTDDRSKPWVSKIFLDWYVNLNDDSLTLCLESELGLEGLHDFCVKLNSMLFECSILSIAEHGTRDSEDMPDRMFSHEDAIEGLTVVVPSGQF